MRDGRAQEAEERKIETRWERDGQRRERHALVEVGRERDRQREKNRENHPLHPALYSLWKDQRK